MYYFILSSPSIKMILEEVLHLSCLAQKGFKMALITNNIVQQRVRIIKMNLLLRSNQHNHNRKQKSRVFHRVSRCKPWDGARSQPRCF